MWLLIYIIATGTYQTHQNHPTLSISHVEFESTISISGRGAAVVPGVHRGPRPQQHPADLRVAAERRHVQRGAVEEAALRGRGAGHRPQQVPHGADVAAGGRLDDVDVPSGHGRCHRGRVPQPVGKPQRAT